MQRLLIVTATLLATSYFAGLSPLHAEDAPTQRQAQQVLSRLGITRGICVLLDPSPAKLAIALARHSELTVYVQLAETEEADAARAQIDAAGLLGRRICVAAGPWSRIHLADNLADAIVITPAAAPLAREHRDELRRVVRPLGKVVLRQREITMPEAAGADDWTHPYHGPDNNPQSTDRLARAPYLTQFLAEPWFVPFPAVTVASSGRLFQAFGHIAFKEREWPWLHTLVAVNGYNGTLLWKRPLEPGFNIHRNTMIATPEVLYVGDNTSCKLIDAATGELRGEITAPENASGPAWKWMALHRGVLYALVGEHEPADMVRRDKRTHPGWPWQPMTTAYDAPTYRWGFGRTLLAIDTTTKKVLWTRDEPTEIDGRAVCMKNGRIYYYSHPNFLACLDAERGEPLWRTADAELLGAIGPHFRAQTWLWGFSTTAYMKCSDRALYFAGPQRKRLVAVAADDGRLLWQHPEGNYQLVLRDDGLYAMGSRNPSLKFDPLTGKVLTEFQPRRAACTRATGAIDAIFCRGETPGPLGNHAGTLRLSTAEGQSSRMALMRPPCHDGVLIAGGLLYWGPWMCDCNLSLVGNICLAPAGDFNFQADADETERLESTPRSSKPIAPLDVKPGDWPTYRADNRRSAASEVRIPAKVSLAWQHDAPAGIVPAAPITAGGLVFTSGSDGVVRALAATSGKLRWKAFTGGAIRYSPAVKEGRLFVGSYDGFVYAFEAAGGRRLWRFRAAPAQRKINLYGQLASTWPVASGVLVDDEVVYAAAGIASYDGTHVYALDATSGRIRWQNNTSGHLAGEGKVSGVSVQGHLLLHKDRLYMAGGNVVSPAVYDAQDGRCLNTLPSEWVKAPRGRELFLTGDRVAAFDQLLYSPDPYQQSRRFAGHLFQANAADVLIRGQGGRIVRIVPNTVAAEKPQSLWQSNPLANTAAVALGQNAVVAAGQLPSSDDSSPPRHALVALAIDDGRPLWTQPLPGAPVEWGLALDHTGRIIVALQGGRVLCFATK